MADSKGPDPRLGEWLERQGFGVVQRAVALKGALPLPSGATGRPWLCQTTQGLFVAAATEAEGAAVNVLDAFPVGYEERVLGARLSAGLHAWAVPVGHSAEARLVLGLGRLAGKGLAVHTDVEPARGPWVDELRPLEAAWLHATLDRNEGVLAWLRTHTQAPLTSSIAAGASAEWRFLLTSDRARLVAITDVGDVMVRELPQAPLEVTEHFGRFEVRQGDHDWRAQLTNGPRFVEIADLPALGRSARLRKAAARIAHRHPALARDLLFDVLSEGDPLDRLALAAVNAGATNEPPPELEDAERQALEQLLHTDPDAHRLVLWMDDWKVPIAHARQVLQWLVDHADSPLAASWSVPFHRAVRARIVELYPDVEVRTDADVALAEHMVFAGLLAEAAAVLEPRLRELPDEDLLSVLPSPKDDLTRPGAASSARTRVLELLVRARAGDGQADVATLAALARQQPLVEARVATLAAKATGSLAHRAQVALVALAPGGLDPQASPAPRVDTEGPAHEPPTERVPTAPRPLPPDHLERLRHPLARGTDVVGRLQSFLARIEPPDMGVLQAYCERLHPDRNPEAIQACADAAVLLGMHAVPVFVSMGERRIGVRSFELPEPFLLIGGAHFDPDSPAFLAAPELRFAVGSEMAHLRFQHSRVTSHDVWTGVWSRGATVLGVTSAFLPFLKFLPSDFLARTRAGMALGAVIPARWLEAVYGAGGGARQRHGRTPDPSEMGSVAAAALDRLRPGSTSANPTDLGTDDRRLLAAHRLMQITADRAGLVLARDLAAALRAMMLLQPHLEPELAVARRIGLRQALARKDADGDLVLPHLAVRVAALVAFWLSDDYPRLAGPGDEE